jgi:hypothetical protein
VLRAGAWAARGLRVPARNVLLADIVPSAVYGRAYGFERACDNLGAIVGPLRALALVSLVGVRTAIALSIIPGLLAALAIVYAIRHAPRAEQRQRQPLRLRVRPGLSGRLGRLMVGVSVFEFGNLAASAIAGLLWTLGSRGWRSRTWPPGWRWPWSAWRQRAAAANRSALGDTVHRVTLARVIRSGGVLCHRPRPGPPATQPSRPCPSGPCSAPSRRPS